jgi:hypothetical protein
MDGLLEGKAWVGFRKVDEFVKQDQRRKSHQIDRIVKEENKQLKPAPSKITDEESK